jgi:hypothetical protein
MQQRPARTPIHAEIPHRRALLHLKRCLKSDTARVFLATSLLQKLR